MKEQYEASISSEVKKKRDLEHIGVVDTIQPYLPLMESPVSINEIINLSDHVNEGIGFLQ